MAYINHTCAWYFITPPFLEMTQTFQPQHNQLIGHWQHYQTDSFMLQSFDIFHLYKSPSIRSIYSMIHIWSCHMSITMAEILARLTSLPRSQSPHGVHNEKYDSQIRDLISYLKQPGNPSDIASASQYLLDVTKFPWLVCRYLVLSTALLYHTC